MFPAFYDICGTTLPAGHDSRLVVLSVILAALASYSALSLAGRMRQAEGNLRRRWHLAAATALGGGIWSMHFVAMLAFRIPLPVAYDPVMTLGSMLLAIGVVAIGFAIVDRGIDGWQRFLIAGIVVGFGVAVMHYTGMAAMRLPAELSYDPLRFIASIVIAVVAATAALVIAYRVQGWRMRAAAALVMAAAIAGMHYTGMSAAQFRPLLSDSTDRAGTIDPTLLAVAVAIVFASLALMGIVSAMVDQRMSEREAASLRRSEARFRAMVRHAADLTYLLAEDRTVTLQSGSTMRALGYPDNFVAGRRFGARIRSPGAKVAFEQFLDRIEACAPGELLETEIDLQRANGTTRTFQVVGQNLLQDPSMEGLLLHLHDITERKRSAELLDQARMRAEAENREKSSFLATISHELRTPVHIIQGFSEMLRDQPHGPLAPEYAEYVSEIHGGAKRLLDIVNDVIELSRFDTGQMRLDETEIDLRRLLEQKIERHREAAEAASVSIELVLPERPLPALRADVPKLTRALRSLLSNAIKFNRPGGSVVLSASVHDNGEVLITVRDSGIGMSPQVLSHALRAFAQVDQSLRRAYEGIGLGLPLARIIAELHGGTLSFETAPDVGTTACISLPAARILRRTVAA